MSFSSNSKQDPQVPTSFSMSKQQAPGPQGTLKGSSGTEQGTWSVGMPGPRRGPEYEIWFVGVPGPISALLGVCPEQHRTSYKTQNKCRKGCVGAALQVAFTVRRPLMPAELLSRS